MYIYRYAFVRIVSFGWYFAVFFSYYSFPRNLVCFILNLVSFLSLAIPKLGMKTALNSKYIW